MNRKILASLLALASAVSLLGCAQKEEAAEAAPAGVAVQVKPVSRRDVATENKVSGTVTAENETSIYVATTAKCTAVYVEAGDSVEKGDKLCTLDLGVTLANYNAARITYDSAMDSYAQQSEIFEQQIATSEQQIGLYEQSIALTEKSIALQEKQLENSRALLAIGAAAQLEVDGQELELERSRMELDRARIELDGMRVQLLSSQAQRDSTLAQLKSGIESARANLEQLGLIMDDVDSQGNVIAPASGQLAALYASEGAYISPNGPVAVISGAEQMKITVYVSEALVPQLSIGDAAHVSVSSASAEFTGTIRSIEQTANAQTKLYGVSLSVPGDVEGLISGMFADVTFYTQTVSDTVAIPSEALLTANDAQYVYIVENNAAKYVPVTTGLTGDGITEILTGLTEGQQLVVVGQQYLSDGDVVRVVGGD